MGGTPESSIFMGLSLRNHPLGGTPINKINMSKASGDRCFAEASAPLWSKWVSAPRKGIEMAIWPTCDARQDVKKLQLKHFQLMGDGNFRQDGKISSSVSACHRSQLFGRWLFSHRSIHLKWSKVNKSSGTIWSPEQVRHMQKLCRNYAETMQGSESRTAFLKWDSVMPARLSMSISANRGLAVLHGIKMKQIRSKLRPLQHSSLR